MVELLMAIVIFGIAASAIMAGFMTALKSTRSDRNRIQASSLAAREVEITRNEFNASSSGPANLAAADYVVDGHPLPGGTAGSPLVVDKTPYTVVRDVEPLIAGSGVSPCDGGGAVQYPQFQVTVTVSWTPMSGVKPVKNTTILTPPKGTISNSLGYVAVKVQDSTGAANAGRMVTVSGPGGTDTDVTGSDGCAVFPEATPGTYTASLNESGYVDGFFVAAPTKTTTVSAGALSQVGPFSYDKKVRLDVTLVTDAGYALPTGYATTKPTLVLYNTAIQPLGVKPVVLTNANGGSVDNLYPFTSGYSVWVGSCAQNNPTATGGALGTATVMSPGTNAPTSVRLAPVKVTMTNAAGLPVAGATIVAAPVSATGCTTGDNPLTLGTTDSTGTLMTSLPDGSWTLKSTTALHTIPVTAWPTTTALQATTPASTIAIQVTT